jgi:hypothetical protein
MSDNEINTQPAFPNLEPVTSSDFQVKDDFLYHLKALTLILETGGQQLLKTHANDLNHFDCTRSWRQPLSMLIELNSTLESLHQYGRDALGKMCCYHVHGTPLSLKTSRRWIRNLELQEETTEQTAAETEPALSQSA